MVGVRCLPWMLPWRRGSRAKWCKRNHWGMVTGTKSKKREGRECEGGDFQQIRVSGGRNGWFRWWEKGSRRGGGKAVLFHPSGRQPTWSYLHIKNSIPGTEWKKDFFLQEKRGRGAWMAKSVKHPTFDFSSGHDLPVCEFKPRVRLCADTVEPAWDLSLSPSLCSSPTRAHELSLSLCLSK